MKRVAVFCGANHGAKPEYSQAAREIAQAIIDGGMEIVYGGGRVGLMGAVADSALEFGGAVIGVIPKSLQEKEVAHESLTALHVVNSMHERKKMMHDLSDAFIALPGGYGTLDEFFEILTWAQLGLHQKPCGILNVAGFFDDLLAFLDRATLEKLLRLEHRRMIIVEDQPKKLLDGLRSYQPRTVDKWINRSQV